MMIPPDIAAAAARRECAEELRGLLPELNPRVGDLGAGIGVAEVRALADSWDWNELGYWPTALRDSGFDSTQPTAWIAEGLLIYLPPDAQDRLFDNITALSAHGSRLATEHMDIKGSSDEWTEKLTERSRRMGSNINLVDLFYTDKRHSAGDYLTSKGWDVTIRSTREAYAVNGFELPEDELIDLAGDSGYLSAILK